MKFNYILIFCILFFSVSCKKNYSDTKLVFDDTSMIEASEDEVSVCSFNIQFLGQFKNRDNKALAEVIKNCDAVAIQELNSSPDKILDIYGNLIPEDVESKAFFEAVKSLSLEMHGVSFSYVLSEGRTGASKILRPGSSAEMYALFYNPKKLKVAPDLTTQIKGGFLSDQLAAHPDYDRVPYAFSLRRVDNSLDFVLISVHLNPNPGTVGKARRKQELDTIAKWIDSRQSEEKDFFILGDMNIQNVKELSEVMPTGYSSLNDGCHPTNTNQNSPKPYDHVMFKEEIRHLVASMAVKIPGAPEQNPLYCSFGVVDLFSFFKKSGHVLDYDHNSFRTKYSDHNPVFFKLRALSQPSSL